MTPKWTEVFGFPMKILSTDPSMQLENIQKALVEPPKKMEYEWKSPKNVTWETEKIEEKIYAGQNIDSYKGEYEVLKAEPEHAKLMEEAAKAFGERFRPLKKAEAWPLKKADA